MIKYFSKKKIKIQLLSIFFNNFATILGLIWFIDIYKGLYSIKGTFFKKAI